jgi:hypothetical protein
MARRQELRHRSAAIVGNQIDHIDRQDVEEVSDHVCLRHGRETLIWRCLV